ncbi:hypothetical protein ZEAMMB73_Zm00001d025297 [Zea mays]|uniref:Uncharacterized protein n=1 Tax=Zea mays TaxID=4577 RepID=A0A1D6J6C5_MAIZE|nr:hypothetical protein ZEAMMB73_Zm00001d025297 [Zea mays]
MDDDDVSPDASPSLAHLGIDPRISTPTPTPPRCRTSPDLPPWTSMTCHPMPPCHWHTQATRALAPTLGTICSLSHRGSQGGVAEDHADDGEG